MSSIMHGLPVCLLLLSTVVVGSAFALPRHRNLLLSPFKEQYFSTVGEPVIQPVIESAENEKEPIVSKFIYQQVMAAVRDAIKDKDQQGINAHTFPLYPKPSKRQRYQQHFDVLAGGGLGR
ncbi:unnamed protein product [Bursaphelenchus okinawaensis]|uniref:Uncharacterized protein n=1 Tax=Bursaphelenchus okinawaensis TaxID=465554 RepID=A0A811KCI3_9BILA|nr:unnamed protein product [Bursaphelenchus okinawaensis]CAG9100938.1 unnamed protein product [Bursaphelenchus okinawaensis]